jgi:hypothetical protein
MGTLVVEYLYTKKGLGIWKKDERERERERDEMCEATKIWMDSDSLNSVNERAITR